MPRAAKIVPLTASEAAAPETPALEALAPEAFTPEAAVVLVPLADLYLSPLNPRQEHEPEGIAALAESLRTLGLMQNLAGLRDEDGRVGIVAGGRRLAALLLAAETNPELGLVPVRLAPDEATARLWAVAENTARAGLHIADEVRAYRRMAETGTPLPAIASAFAVTEAHVRRRLRLASLPEPILDALKAGQIGAGHAQAFTVCPDAARQLTLLPEVVQRRMSEDSLRRVLTQEQVRADDRRAVFVGLDAYEAAGGTLTRDLFAAGDDEAFLDNPALLERLFAEKLETAAEAKRAEGWRWIETHLEPYLPWNVGAGMGRVYPLPDDLSDEDEEELHTLHDLAEADELDDEGHARLDELENARGVTYQPEHRAVAGGWLYVDRDGELCEALGFIRAEDRENAVAAGAVEPPRASPSFGPGGTRSPGSIDSAAAADAAKGPYSYVLMDDMKAIRLAAVQTALLDHPELVLDLVAFALQPESGYPGRIMAVRPERQRIDPTEEEGFTRDPRFKEGPERYQDRDSLLADFSAFRSHGPEHRNAVLTEAFARTLCYKAGTTDRAAALFAEIERESGAQVRAVWRPTARNFFGRVTAAYLDDLLTTLLDLGSSNPGLKAFRAMKKADKAHAMERLFSDPEYQAVWGVTPETKARIDAWVPDCA